ncbi:MAG: ImmA/IrrE family metallo-endopeptidase [Candidatus Thiodiazotropha sp.]
MPQDLWRHKATKLGENFAKEQKCTSLPVKPIEVAEKLGMLVEPLPSDKEGVSGMLLYSGNKFGIMYASYLNNPGFENFSVAHELGHYATPGHPEKILISGQHVSHAGFTSPDQTELEADHFAAGFLMPGYLFDPEINKFQSGMKAVEALSRACTTSLTATAIRYAQRTPDPIAIVVSERQTIRYCFMSDEFKEIQDLTWIIKGTPLPKDTVTSRFNSHKNNILNAIRAEGEASLLDWFGSNSSLELYEEVIGLGGYGRTLTVLSIDEMPDQDELDEEDELIESWTPRFKR